MAPTHPTGDLMLAHEDALRDALRQAASALRAHGPEFALAGSYALWVHGAPEPVHDVDIVVADTFDVLAIPMPVLPPTIILTQKLKSLHEHHCDFAKLLPAARAVRERVDWSVLRAETKDNDFATAFLFLLDRLGITESPVN